MIVVLAAALLHLFEWNRIREGIGSGLLARRCLASRSSTYVWSRCRRQLRRS